MKVSAKDQIDQGAYGRSLKPGTYQATILVSEDYTSNKGNECVKMTFSVDAPPEAAPEGKVKVDHYPTPGQFSMKNFIEEFYPDAVGKDANIDPSDLVGKRCRVVTRISQEKKNPDGTVKYAARVEVSKVLKRDPEDKTPDLDISKEEEEAGEQGGEQQPF